ncbi:PAS domain S-box protein [Thiorhodococcus mannitoliphagus]
MRRPQGDAVPARSESGGDWEHVLIQSAEFADLAEQVMQSGCSYQGRFVLDEPAGQRQLDLTLAPSQDAAGQRCGLTLCAVDLTPMEAALCELSRKAEICQLLAEHTFDWEYWIGSDGGLRWISPACQEVTGYSADEFQADPRLLVAIMHPQDRHRFSDHLSGEPSCQPGSQLRLRLQHASGEVRWIEHACKPVYWPDGSFAGRRVVNRDVTDTMKVEQALRESEHQFRLMFELATVGMVVVEPKTRRLLRVNERLCRLLGYEADELLRMTFSELTHPDDLAFDAIRYQGALHQEDTDYFVEKRYIRKDGRVIWALVNATFIRDEAGHPLRALAAIIDITDRRAAEARARELAAVVECSSDFIGIASLDRRGAYLNEAGKKLVGLDPDAEPEAFRIDDFILPEDLPFFRETIMRAVERSGRWAGEFRFRHFRTQEPIAVFYDALRIDDPETGRPLQYATVTRDIRKEKAAEEALLEGDRRKDEFLAMVGHELRNPMAPIRNAVEIIRAIGIGEDQRIAWAVEVLDRQTAHMGRLLDDLLDVSRILRDGIELESREIALRDVVRQSVDGVRAMMQERGHQFHYELPPAEVRVQGDPVRLSQILLNLLVNAARYTANQGEVRVDYVLAGAEVVVEIKDNGQGMSEAQIESMFGAFTQGVPPPESAAGGLGLGLTIARRLAELHGGRLEALSDGPGRGAELRLYLPLLSDDRLTSADTPAVAQVDAGCAEALKVLVVDDNADVSSALAMLLEIQGYQVRTASSGHEALDLVSDFRPRLALLDIGLPGMDGLELARRLRQRYPDPGRLMLVALTGLGHEHARERSLAAGFDDHLVKPLEQSTLRALLARLSC